MKKWWRDYLRYRSLKRDLQRRARDLVTSVNPDAPKDEELECQSKQLGNLRDLIDGLNSFSPLRRLERIVITGGLLVAVVVVTFLIFKRVRSTEVEVDLVASEIHFTLAQKSPVLQPINVGGLEVFEVRNVQLIGSKDGSLNAPSGAVAHIEKLTGTEKKTSEAEITLPGLNLPATTAISLRANSTNDRFTITINAPAEAEASPLDVTAVGPLKIFLGSDSVDTSEIAAGDAPYPIRIVPLNHEVTLDFSSNADTTIELLPQIPIDAPSFHQEETESQARQVSAVKSGSIVLTEMENGKTDLRPFEPLTIQGCDWNASQRCLRLRRLALSKKGIEAQLYGNVTSFETGPSNVKRNLMPSLLEWINSNHHLKLLWTAILFTIGLVLGSARWLKLWG